MKELAASIVKRTEATKRPRRKILLMAPVFLLMTMIMLTGKTQISKIPTKHPTRETNLWRKCRREMAMMVITVKKRKFLMKGIASSSFFSAVSSSVGN